MLIVAKLHNLLAGLDPEAQIVVGIIDGPRYCAAYAQQEVCARAIMRNHARFELQADALALVITCYEHQRPWHESASEHGDDGPDAMDDEA